MMQLDPRVPMPKRIAALRRHKGLPVPSMVLDDAWGVPNFRVIDMEKWQALYHARGCGICGQRMGERVWFIGGPGSIDSHVFTDLPMHFPCAVFALRVCPFLALPRFKFIDAEVDMGEGVVLNVNDHVSTRRPERFGLASTMSYKAQLLMDLTTKVPSAVLRAGPWTVVQWWQHGARVD